MKERLDYLQRYHLVRALLNRLVAYLELVRSELGQETPLFAQHDYISLAAQAQTIKQWYCERCGARFVKDLLGPEAYAIHSYHRICVACAIELVPWPEQSTRRMSRLMAYAMEHPDLLAGWLVQAQQRRHLTDAELEHWLGSTATGVLRLALSAQPRADSLEEDLIRIAADTGCSSLALRTIITESAHLLASVSAPPHQAAPERFSSPRPLDEDERVARYRQIARRVVERIAEAPRADAAGIESLLIIDEERDHYLHMTTGWHQHRRMYAPILHLRVKNGKIVIERDSTDNVGDELRRAGVPNEDILFGFIHPAETNANGAL
jgi:XisI protein